MDLLIDPHPSLLVRAFTSSFTEPLGSTPTPPDLVRMLDLGVAVPLQRSEALRTAVRDMLRHGGYKPTGRGKPASEYLVRAAEEGGLRSINAAVDACNVVSLHSGFPISVVDLDLAEPPFRLGIADRGVSYVFNPAGQEIDVGGLVCLFDAAGPVGNAVKDSQRTKTHDGTVRTLSVIWGCDGFEPQLARAAEFYQNLITGLGASVDPASART